MFRTLSWDRLAALAFTGRKRASANRISIGRNVVLVMGRQLQSDLANEPGTGAAGGLGFGLRSFLGARLAPGFGLFADHTGLRERLSAADLVVTGEGAIDSSTLMGKGVGELALLCRQVKKPCLGLGGVVPDRAAAAKVFTRTYALTPDFTDRETAFAKAEESLARLAEQASAAWSQPG
jgi:glycerate kinase